MKKLLMTYAALLALCACSSVAGVYVLFGLGWSLLAAGACLLGISEILRSGMKGMLRV